MEKLQNFEIVHIVLASGRNLWVAAQKRHTVTSAHQSL
jgi:hypothetical protein